MRILPYRSAENYIAGAVLTFVDVTKLAKAQTDLSHSESQFRAIAELVPDLLWSSDASGAPDWVNQRWSDYTSQPPGAVLGWRFLSAVHPSERESARRNHEAIAQVAGLHRFEHRIRAATGEYRWFRINATAVRQEDGTVRCFGAVTDIDDLKRADDRGRLLLAELQHRVKNILAVVRSISSRSLDTSQTLEDFAAHFSGRLDALARTQSVLARRGDGGVDLEELVRDELAASAAHDGLQVEVNGPPVLLKEKAAEVFALALHELATNAVKYGALARPEGRVSVDWRLMNASDGRRLSLQWRESGVKALDSRPSRTGFGRDLIERGLTYDLGAITSLDFAPGGVRCTVELPLGERVLAMDGAEEDDVQAPVGRIDRPAPATTAMERL